ncbi:hypothetical protein CARUB_v10002977mg, partial [Capsella rubella]
SLVSQLETMTTTTMSNLPKYMVEGILSRVPFKYMRSAMLLTCKNWNALFRSKCFAKMILEKEEEAARELGETRMVVMMIHNVYLMGITINENPSTRFLGKLTYGSEQVKIYQVFHCEGLLLCILKEDDTKILVWNPYLGQTRWIQTSDETRGYKILRFIDELCHFNLKYNVLRYEIYDFDTDLWTTLSLNPDWRIVSHCGITLKGNTYWCANERNAYRLSDHIICFDFTRERFGSLLPLPFKAWGSHSPSLSLVREENIAALFQTSQSSNVEIWITTKIDVTNVSWSNFFTVNMIAFGKKLLRMSFLIDEDKKVAMVFGKDIRILQNTMHIIGESGCLRIFEIGQLANKNCWPRVCSYVPSIVQIKQHIQSS